VILVFFVISSVVFAVVFQCITAINHFAVFVFKDIFTSVVLPASAPVTASQAFAASVVSGELQHGSSFVTDFCLPVYCGSFWCQL
jgi:hypothetical protein